MCGIVGYVGDKKAISKIMTGLRSLEYRGYDSAGIAYIKDGIVKIIKREGPIDNLDKKLNYDEVTNIGISHTRWSTHGVANDINSHPHRQGKITIVHNGIIENYESLKKNLTSLGYIFKSNTDTEVASALIDNLYKETGDMLLAINKASGMLEGSYAFNIINDDYPDTVFGTRKDSPLIVGVGQNENILASDIPAILHITNKYVVLNNYDVVVMKKDKLTFYNKDNEEVQKDIREFLDSPEVISKNGYEHYMLKEINEQAEIVKKLLKLYTEGNKVTLSFDLKKYKTIDIVACGSASFAGQLGKFYIEKFLDIPTSVTFASEYRYQKNFFDKDKLVILISQSGETADTLAVLKLAKENNVDTLAIVNRKDSSIAREADNVIYTEAGIEISVATTKAYLAQVIVLLLLAIRENENESKILDDLKILPNLITKEINDYDYESLAKLFYKKENVFYLGRGVDYFLAMEGSLKLKEISYIHSEAFAAGELKHGSISLVDENFGIIAVVTDKNIGNKTVSNLKEVSARNAKILTITNIKDEAFSDYKIEIDDISDILNPLLAIVPMQLIAYNIAKLKKCNIDKPRNLAKSVTVE